jgi:hypothetical protein
MKPKLWECTVLIPGGQQVTFLVEAYNEQSAVESVESFTNGICKNITHQPEFEKLKVKLKDIIVSILILYSVIFVIFNYWKFILLFCGVCLLLFLLLIINET